MNGNFKRPMLKYTIQELQSSGKKRDPKCSGGTPGCGIDLIQGIKIRISNTRMQKLVEKCLNSMEK